MESSNLHIRESDIADCEYFAHWESRDDIQECFTMPKDRGYDDVVRELVLREKEEDKLQFTILDRISEKPIGRIYISNINKDTDSLDITRIYIGDENYKGKGLGKEAMRLILDHSFITLHMERVTLDHLPANEKGGKFFEGLGFTYEGVLRNAGKKEGRYVDFHQMSMLRAEYFEKYRSIA